MKVALFSLLSVICVQGLYAASLPASSSLNKDNGYVSVYSSESKVELYDNRMNLGSCLEATKKTASLIWSAWGLYQKRNGILSRADADKKKCTERPTPEEVEKCQKDATDAEQKDLADLMKELWDLGPVLAALSFDVVKCLI